MVGIVAWLPMSGNTSTIPGSTAWLTASDINAPIGEQHRARRGNRPDRDAGRRGELRIEGRRPQQLEDHCQDHGASTESTVSSTSRTTIPAAWPNR